MTFKIRPYLDAVQDGFFITNEELHYVHRSNYLDTFGFYQALFGVLSFMTLTNLGKFRIHTPKANSSLLWKKWNSCSYKRGQSLQMGVQDFQPDPLYLSEKLCDDQLLGSAYQHLIEWDSSGEKFLSPQAQEVVNEVMEEFLTAATLGFRELGTAGSLYDVDSVEFADNTSAEQRRLFKEAHGSMLGWMSLAQDMAADGHKHMDQNILTDDMFDVHGRFDGEILDLYERLLSNSKKELVALVNRGGVVSNSRYRFMPLFICTDSIYAGVVARFKFEADRIATNERRVRKVEIGGSENPVPQYVYYIDDTPVIPMSELTAYDQFITNNTHFAGIVASGNIQIGSSFAPVMDINGNPIGIAIDRVMDRTRDDYGSWSMLSHAIGKAAIADHTYFSGTFHSTK
jgi:hypothetical protein